MLLMRMPLAELELDPRSMFLSCGVSSHMAPVVAKLHDTELIAAELGVLHLSVLLLVATLLNLNVAVCANSSKGRHQESHAGRIRLMIAAGHCFKLCAPQLDVGIRPAQGHQGSLQAQKWGSQRLSHCLMMIWVSNCSLAVPKG